MEKGILPLGTVFPSCGRLTRRGFCFFSLSIHFVGIPLLLLRMNTRIFKEDGFMKNNAIINAFTNEQLKTEVPEIAIGDTVIVHNRIKEGQRERIQLFEGTVIAKKNGGISETFTVRRVAYGCGVEKTFPLHSPNVAKVELVRHGKVRRAKLYYLRDRVGKSAKLKEIL